MLNLRVEGLRNLRCILLIMEVATGLKMNWCKSMVSPVAEVPCIDEIASILGCDVAKLPITYLGLPLSAKSSSKVIWNPIIEKMGNRLSGWKGQYLSRGGKLVLLRSVLSSLPTYFLSLFQARVQSVINLSKFSRISCGIRPQR